MVELGQRWRGLCVCCDMKGLLNAGGSLGHCSQNAMEQVQGSWFLQVRSVNLLEGHLQKEQVLWCSSAPKLSCKGREEPQTVGPAQGTKNQAAGHSGLHSTQLQGGIEMGPRWTLTRPFIQLLSSYCMQSPGVVLLSSALCSFREREEGRR